MKSFRLLLPAACFAAVLAAAAAPKDAPPPTPPDAETLKAITDQAQKLHRQIAILHSQGVGDPVSGRHRDLSQGRRVGSEARRVLAERRRPRRVREVLDRGLLRASQQARGEPPWLSRAGQTVVRAYRSRIDGSVQPYAVTFPADYGKDRKKHWRLDVVLHGRNDGLTEVAFLHQHDGDQPAPPTRVTSRSTSTAAATTPTAGPAKPTWSRRSENFLAVEQLLGRGALDRPRPRRAARLLDGRGRHLAPRPASARRSGASSAPAPASPPPTATSRACPTSCRRTRKPACTSTTPSITPRTPSTFPSSPTTARTTRSCRRPATSRRSSKQLGIPMTLLVAPGLKHEFPPEWQKKAEAEYAKYVDQGPAGVSRRTCTSSPTL